MRFSGRHVPLCAVVSAEERNGVYVFRDKLQFRRVDVWGVVVRRFVGENYLMLILDDFTATIPVFLFDDLRSLDIDEGDIVRVIGMVRERDGERRIVAEVVRKISGEEEILMRLRNLMTLLRGTGEEVSVEEVEVVDVL